MSNSQNQKIVYGSLIAGVLGLIVAMYSAIQVSDLSAKLDQVSSESTFDHYLSSNEENINTHIKTRINVFVDDQKKEQIESKFVSYEQAVKSTASGKHIYGKEDARYSLVVFSDIECSYCKKYHKTPKNVVDKYPDHVNWQFKHFPLSFHDPVAGVEAVATECAAEVGGNRAFWVFLQQMMDETKSNGQGAGDLQTIAERIGLDGEKFVSCIREGKHRKTIDEHIAKGKELGVNSTPVTFLVDNKTGKNIMLKGMVSEGNVLGALQKIKQEADAALNQSGKPEQPATALKASNKDEASKS